MIARIKGLGKKDKASEQTQSAPLPFTRHEPLPVTATVTYGGWLPRTAMHLDEVYAFLTSQSSSLPLSKQQLLALHTALDLQFVSKEAGYLEYVRATTNSNIEFRYYEDGLYLLEMASKNPEAAARTLKTYHDKNLVPALEYLFSVGAPLPQMGRNGDHQHPVAVSISWPHPQHFELGTSYGHIVSQIESRGICVYKTNSHIFVVSGKNNPAYMRDLVDMQIFFREYQSRLEYLLHLQRKVWTDTNHILNRRHIKPADLPKLHRLLNHQRQLTTLAQGRLEQMDAYLQTRASFAEQLDLNEHLLMLFHFRFETLEDSYHYLRRNWEMTKSQVTQASDLLTTIQAQSTHSLLASQRFMIVLLTVSSIATWLSASNVFEIDHAHVVAFAVVLIAAMLVAWLSTLKLNYSEYRVRLTTRKPKSKSEKF